ncbi:MAG: SAM-dependent MidA family methyltransferase [Myxococcota bacterium]|jgi:SAM-dependent MidA family methyltransferase
MPYDPYDPYQSAELKTPLDTVLEPINPPHEYYENEIEDAERQFEEIETTLSHLFRKPHELLDGGSYAERVVDSLVERGHLSSATRTVVEVGGGMGHFAAGVLGEIQKRFGDTFGQLHYTIVDLAPTLRAEQKRRLTDAGFVDRVTWVAANAESLDLEPGSVDLLLCNEVVGDFTVVKLTREALGLDQTMVPEEAYASWSESDVQKLGENGRLIRDYMLPLRDAPDEFYFNLGALQFVERVAAALKPGGSAYITEYGEVMKYPVASTQLDHLEFSIHFGHLHHLAKQLGLDAEVAYVQDLIKLDRDAMTLATTRTYFSSLVAMLAHFGLTLDKTAWTKDMFATLLGDTLPLEHIGDIRFRVVDERCMGLAPHEFKALLVKRPEAENETPA